jgi:translation initiation factor RLI1
MKKKILLSLILSVVLACVFAFSAVAGVFAEEKKINARAYVLADFYSGEIVESKNAASLIVDHDIVFIDYISDRAMVFNGEPGLSGKASKPTDLRTSMNTFLKDLGITFRRDKETKRPRVNKYDSYLDREQKEQGEYYYLKEN